MRSGPVRMLAALLTLALASPALPGAWPREKGGAFLSFSEEYDRADNGYASLYAEYGLTPRYTLGIEAGYSSAGDTTLLVWMQRSLGGTGQTRTSASLGLGASQQQGTLLPMAQAGLSWGRGIATRLGDGWISADARLRVVATPVTATIRIDPFTEVSYNYMLPETGMKTDLTLGLRPWAATTLIGQLRLEQQQDGPFSARLATSLVRDISAAGKVELGLIHPLKADSETALRLATWLEF